MFKPVEEQAKNMRSKYDSVFLLREILTWHKIGLEQDVSQVEKAELIFENIILTYGVKDGIRQRFIESRSEKII
jgi:hypothetical protein